MKDNKPKWRKSKLLILVRGRKEEVVLIGCKSSGLSDNSGGSYGGCNWACPTYGGGTEYCSACSSLIGS